MIRVAKSLCLLAFLATTAVSQAAVQVKKVGDVVRVSFDDQLFTEYHYKNVSRPFLYPVIGPTGEGLTRNYPMKDVPGEARDHVHHRSLYFAHGDVNGVDFWAETVHRGKVPGLTVHDAFLELKSGEVGVIKTRNRLMTGDRKKQVGTEIFTIEFSRKDDRRYIDFTAEIAATHGPIVMGDTKEGTMAIRLASTMRVRAVDKSPGKGQIITSAGVTGKEAWGTRAAWVDYYGPVKGQTVGVAIFDHPTNLRHPTWWHVRDYGLFAANPFGKRYFERLEDKTAGNYTIPAGKSLTLRYRFYLHKGKTVQAQVAEEYRHWTR
ncbi:MAG: hypothetical protein D6763_06330 [Alphaproteobacteria bacterium]|nr:MAG: hypothetical protein D6763_06330 [Alphaproteobacteria bacterium]